jgi:hypothetical protein
MKIIFRVHQVEVIDAIDDAGAAHELARHDDAVDDVDEVVELQQVDGALEGHLVVQLQLQAENIPDHHQLHLDVPSLDVSHDDDLRQQLVDVDKAVVDGFTEKNIL